MLLYTEMYVLLVWFVQVAGMTTIADFDCQHKLLLPPFLTINRNVIYTRAPLGLYHCTTTLYNDN